MFPMQWGRYGQFNLDTAKTRFMSKVVVQPDGCWQWTGAVNGGTKGRYGSIGLAGKHLLAHRAAWLLFHGEDPGTSCICHRCDNGLCVNPDHLFRGTQADNMHDMESKGRSYHKRGELHGRAKLTWDDVAIIRQLHADGMSKRAVARRYPHVNRGTVRAVIDRRSWITKQSQSLRPDVQHAPNNQ